MYPIKWTLELCEAKGWGIKKFEYQTIDNFLAAHKNVRQLGRLVDIGFDDRLERNVSGFFIPRPNKIPCFDFLNCDKARCGSDSRSGNKACAIFQITGIAAHAALYCR